MRGDWQFSDVYPIVNGIRRKRFKFHDTAGGFIWGHLNKTIYRSDISSIDNPTAVATLPDREREIVNMHAISGERVLISTKANRNISGNNIGRLYLFESGVITPVLDFPVGWADEWSFSGVDDLIFVGEYGNKNSADNARRVYKSVDGGKTFAEIFQIPQAIGNHTHKILYDPYTDIVWASHGDEQDGIYYAEGPNHTEKVFSYESQPTAAVATRNHIFWGSDSTVTGILQYEKSTGMYSQPLDLRGTRFQGFIFDMKKDSSGNVYAATVGGYYDMEIGVFRCKAPLYEEWELIGEYTPPRIGTYYGIRKIAYASENTLIFKCYNGDGSLGIKRLTFQPRRK